VVPVLRDVGQQREVAEGADHHHRLLRGEPIEHLRQAIARGRIFLAAARNGQLADIFHQCKSRVALVGPHGVPEDAAEQPDVLSEARVLLVSVVHISIP
jgi:hypothetical protein